jgi:transcriptional regulator GlxA family with amidase domain
MALNVKNGFQSVLDLLSILHDLAVVPGLETLSDTGFSNVHLNYDNKRLNKVYEYMNKNYNQQVTLAEVARIAGMSEASFSRFIKQRSGKTFIDSLNEIKLEYASRMLIETTNTIAEIAYNCGFNNISNFNRVFKCKKFCIPSEFRETYSGYKVSA